MRSLNAAFPAATVPPKARREIAASIANLDPTHEHACCYLMQTHAEEGDVAGALRIYEALWDWLDRDYGMEPSRPTENWWPGSSSGLQAAAIRSRRPPGKYRAHRQDR